MWVSFVEVAWEILVYIQGWEEALHKMNPVNPL